jgi:glycine cleavage system H protein
MPVDGEVISANQALEDAPELLNQSPYADGWIIEIKPENSSQLEAIMDKEALSQNAERGLIHAVFTPYT